MLLNIDMAWQLFDGAPFSLQEVLDLDAGVRMRSFDLTATARFQGAFRERDFMAENVAAILEGSGPLLKDSYLILCAHYDHLGTLENAGGDV